jgi:YidC/Oxa1 family membrane protein insertase
VEGFYNQIGFLAPVVAKMLKGIHTALAGVFPSGSGWAWGLSIVLLTISIRILIFPLFVKQVKSQRRMQELAPKVKELQKKHQGDRETLNTELMKLYKDHGTNPVSGCLPLILQMPVFFALFRVMNEFKPKDGVFIERFGLSERLIEEGAKAKVFGAPISASFLSSDGLLRQLGGDKLTVQLVTVLMIVTMGATQFWTQRQIMARAGGPVDPQQAQIRKMMLYVLPVFFAVAGVNFPIGVLLYWVTTNFWSMGQQAWVIKRMPPVPTGGAAKAAAAKKDVDLTKKKPAAQQAVSKTGTAVATASKPSQQQRPSSGRAAGSRKNKNRKGGRR